MENQRNLIARIKTHPALYVFIVVCVLLILIILFSQHTDTRVLTDEIFLRAEMAR